MGKVKEVICSDCGNYCLEGLHEVCYGQRLCTECLVIFMHEPETMEGDNGRY